MTFVEFDDYIALSKVENIVDHVNSHICVWKVEGEEDGAWDLEPVLFHAVQVNATRCLDWLFKHGGNPNLQWRRSSLLFWAFRHTPLNYELVITKGARLELADYDWITLQTRNGQKLFFTKEIKLMLYRGIRVPDNNGDVHPLIREAYRVILAREKACKEACYTFIRINGLPRDLVRWMLETFILPSKREEFWYKLKMPKDFE